LSKYQVPRNFTQAAWTALNKRDTPHHFTQASSRSKTLLRQQLGRNGK
jgi:hypothetical protein